jgi:hypothetical protein
MHQKRLFATVFKSRFYHKTEVPKEWTWCQTGLQLTSAQLSEALVRESDMVIDVERFQGSMMTWWRVLCIGVMFWECGQWLWWSVSQRKFSLPKCPICLRKLTFLLLLPYWKGSGDIGCCRGQEIHIQVAGSHGGCLEFQTTAEIG